MFTCVRYDTKTTTGTVIITGVVEASIYKVYWQLCPGRFPQWDFVQTIKNQSGLAHVPTAVQHHCLVANIHDNKNKPGFGQSNCHVQPHHIFAMLRYPAH